MPTPCSAPEPDKAYHSVCSVETRVSGVEFHISPGGTRPGTGVVRGQTRVVSWGNTGTWKAEFPHASSTGACASYAAAIVRSAATEFARRGFAAASINAILEQSNATKGAMYFHFASKEDLARAVLDEDSSTTVPSSAGGWTSPISTLRAAARSRR